MCTDPSAIRALAADTEAHDGAPPLSDEGLIRIGRPDVREALRWDDGRLVGYAQLADDVAEVVAAPGPRAAQIAADLLAELEDHATTLTVWAHGTRTPIGSAAQARGYDQVRTLWQLRRPLTDIPSAPLASGVAVLPFLPGSDEQAWLAVNAAAFATHPEQGRWTIDDLLAREAEPWFDPAGFLLAWRGAELLGFHWTKLHSPQPLGEVYVLGVAPAAQGLGLGAGLLAAGLKHLAGRGARTALLYVDDDNTAAMALYEKYGFERYDVDVQYRRHSG